MRSTHPAPRDSKAPVAAAFRSDIQGLRAIAVGLVLVYHLTPHAVSGGYIGVDVFFVISGYLITGLLARELRRHGRIDLLAFYGRRARRLLPAVAVVLTATFIGAFVALPVTQIPETFKEIVSSALYFQNWTLAQHAVDYLTAGNAVSPVQHFWSLSVEEQFYLVWPLAFLAAGLVARRSGQRAGRLVLGTFAVVVVGASLFWSIRLTRVNPASAYFVTTTRMWEFGVGGMLAVLPVRVAGGLARQYWLGWLGLAAIAYAAFTMNAATPFPGAAALLPALGTAAALGCGGTGRFGPWRLTALRPAVFLGGISYSLYLWHFPLIVLWQWWSGTVIHLRSAVVLAAAAIVLAWLTTVLVEDPIRTARALKAHRTRSLATALTVLVPVAAVVIYQIQTPAPPRPVLDAAHPGAAALRGAVTSPGVPMVPTLTAAAGDRPDYYAHGCETGVTSTTLNLCYYGDTTDPALTVALVGDSTAGQWLTPLDDIGKARGWKIVTVLHSQCPFTSTVTYNTNSKSEFTSCYLWGQRAQRALLNRIHPDVVLTSDRPNLGVLDQPTASPAARAAIGSGMATYWAQLLDAGISVVGIHESPEIDRNIPDCLARRTGSVRSCSVPASAALTKQTPENVAAEQVNGAVPIVDLNDFLCNATACPPVIGNVLVYRDDHHVTSTYAKSLTPFLARRLLDTGVF